MKITEKQLRQIVRESLEEFTDLKPLDATPDFGNKNQPNDGEFDKRNPDDGARTYDLAGLTGAVKAAFAKEFQTGTLNYITDEEFKNIMQQVFNTFSKAGKIKTLPYKE
jgi:hypothetical protein